MSQAVRKSIDICIDALNHLQGASVFEAPSMVAYDPRSAQEILTAFFRSLDRRLLEEIAVNPNTPATVLMHLAENCDSFVREAVIDNLAAPFEVLSVLARDEDVDVRFSVAENHNSPPDLLLLLMEDENPYVADRAEKTYKRVSAAKNTVEFMPRRRGELNRFYNRLRCASSGS